MFIFYTIILLLVLFCILAWYIVTPKAYDIVGAHVMVCITLNFNWKQYISYYRPQMIHVITAKAFTGLCDDNSTWYILYNIIQLWYQNLIFFDTLKDFYVSFCYNLISETQYSNNNFRGHWSLVCFTDYFSKKNCLGGGGK